MNPATKIGRRCDEATHVFSLAAGQHLRVAAGPMKGLIGVFVDRPPGGLLLLRVGCGMYVEVSERCVVVALERKRR